MSVDTIGRLKGYIHHEDIFNFIKEKYDKDAKCLVSKSMETSLVDISWDYTINEGSESDSVWYSYHGFINFHYNDEERQLFYCYDNLNHLENLDYYKDLGLEDMVRSETTHLSLGFWGSSVKIIKEILENFNGGWLDANDCDENPYEVVYPINLDNPIKPLRRVTMEEIEAMFGEKVIIVPSKPNS